MDEVVKKEVEELLLVSVTVGTACTSVLLLSSGVAFAATSIEGFPETLKAALDGLKAYLDFLIEMFKIVLGVL